MENNYYGYLVVSVTTANGTIPIEGARVRIYEKKEEKITVIKNMKTDLSGRTQTLTLPCPPREESQSPGAKNPYSVYIVETDCEGYGSVQNNDVEVFDGVKSIQNVILVPKIEDRFIQNERKEL